MSDKEYEVPVVTLEDDLGNEKEFEVLDIIDYENDEYVCLIETDEEADEIHILKVDSIDDEEEIYLGLDDEELVMTIFNLFKEKHKDEFDF